MALVTLMREKVESSGGREVWERTVREWWARMVSANASIWSLGCATITTAAGERPHWGGRDGGETQAMRLGDYWERGRNGSGGKIISNHHKLLWKFQRAKLYHLNLTQFLSSHYSFQVVCFGSYIRCSKNLVGPNIGMFIILGNVSLQFVNSSQSFFFYNELRVFAKLALLCHGKTEILYLSICHRW